MSNDLIERLGGYNKTKLECEKAKNDGFRKEVISAFKEALLEYRREHNIFEVGDKVVYVDEFMHDGISAISSIDGRAWLNNDAAVCIFEMIRHATDAEIQAGRRLP